ncbi:MAG TPA: formyltransferase family protein [Polyangiaceae bacterium]|nr:formyltransferase family protein [Polyangiaceae bacterium]
MKIAYFGLPLGALLLARDGHQLGPVVLSPVEAPGRFRLRAGRARPGQPEPSALIDTLDADDDLESRVQRALNRESPDLLVSWFWTRKLPVASLEAPPLGAIGVHPSLLPRHRGPNPFYWAIDSGDDITGVTAHRLSAEYDTGPVFAARRLRIGDRDAWQLARALDRPSLELLRETALRFARGERLAQTTQDEAQASWAPEPTGDALRVDFGWTTERILRRIRALSPTPGLALEVEGVRLFVTRAEAAGWGRSPSHHEIDPYLKALLPGEAHISDALLLRTGDGAVRVVGAYFPEGEASAPDAAGVVAKLSQRPKP